MALLDRVTTLIKANINDLIDKAEDPEKLLKQLLLDMQNQFMQVKTQLAMAIADQHLLEKRRQGNAENQMEWVRKAQLALQKNQDDLARAALERSLTYETGARNFEQQIEDQVHQVHILKNALNNLEQKMTETQTRSELLLAEHRRARVALRSGTAVAAALNGNGAAMDRMKSRIAETGAQAYGQNALLQSNVEERLASLEKDDKVERLLAELKARPLLTS